MTSTTFAEQVIAFNAGLSFPNPLPDGVGIMNPFRDNEWATPTAASFYRKYYSDDRQRWLMLGINPGRHGAGLTGVPFTDTKRMEEVCGIPMQGIHSHEPSSVFVYAVIAACGGPTAFYHDVYINSVCPLGFVKQQPGGKAVNYNYYDSKELQRLVEPFAVDCLERQLQFGIRRDVVFVMGTGKNAAFVRYLNDRYKWFGRVVALEHPRYVVQYKARNMEHYVSQYVQALEEARGLIGSC
jgi:hypothetical protein